MFRDSLRLFKIIHTLLKARLDKEVDTFSKPKIVSFLLFISPWRLYQSKKEPGERLRFALEELGPIFIKFGQLLSTRPDVVPGEIAKSLKVLQDDLPHFSDKQAIEIIEKEMNCEIISIFKDFNPTPLALSLVHISEPTRPY